MNVLKIALSATVLFTAIQIQAQTTPPLKVFRDPTHGVSFAYPAHWSTIDGFYIPALILQNDRPTPDSARFSVGFETQASVPPGYASLRKTNLAGVQFAYLPLAHMSPQSCMQRTGTGGDETAKDILINGVTFRQTSTSDAALGHQVDRIAYAAMSGATCYLFEAAIHFANSEEAQRELTLTEKLVLRKQLDDVVKTITINKFVTKP